MKRILTLAVVLVSLFLAKGASAAIYPTHSSCVGTPVNLYDSSSSGVSVGGTWSSSNITVATIGASSGILTGISAGTTVITYVSTSSVVTTVIYTVYPLPSAIGGGGSPFCVGSTITLTNATSGGTWISYSSYVATVGASTGVCTGMHAGTATIVYQMGTGCQTSTVVTVSGTTSDSVTGPSSVCVGSTISLTAALGGGTWSSSNPSVASVSGGVVTGVTSGTAIITHSVSTSCGTSTGTKLVTVTSTTSPGSISGPTSVGIGFTISLSSSTSGGTWSSSSTSIATISGSGVVTGVAAGTVVITYTVTGCSGPASTTYTVTVTVPNCITGNVLFTGAAYYGPVKVWLIKFNPSTLILSAVDSAYVYCTSGTSVGYQFCGMGTDSFRVKAAVDSPTSGTGYLPTYHTSSAFWHSATVIYHVSGTLDAGKHITMGYGTSTGGPGFVGGNVTTGANKGTASAPAVGLLMYCVKSTGEILQKTYTDASGNYSFSSLPTDVAMTVHPELINYATTEFPTFTLTTAAPSKTAANFIQRTVSMKIEPIATSVDNIASVGAAINVFPNPASGTLNIQWNTANAGTGTITIADVTGRQVLKTTVDMSNASGAAPINISGISNGIYMMNIKANGVNYNAKVEVK